MIKAFNETRKIKNNKNLPQMCKLELLVLKLTSQSTRDGFVFDISSGCEKEY